jgi:hypothetical protein
VLGQDDVRQQPRAADDFLDVDDRGDVAAAVADEDADPRRLVRDVALDQANLRYKGGIVTYLEVVSTENAALAARLTAVDIEIRRADSTILLIRALGGDWEKPTIAAAPAPPAPPANPPG